MIDTSLEAVNSIVEILSVISVPTAAAIDRLRPKALLFAFDAKLLQGHANIFSGIGLRHKARPPSFHALNHRRISPREEPPVIPGGSLRASIHDSSRLTDNFANGMCPWLFFEPHPPPAFFCERHPAAGFLRTACAAGFLRTARAAGFLRTACAADFLRTACAAGFLRTARAAGFLRAACAAGFFANGKVRLNLTLRRQRRVDREHPRRASRRDLATRRSSLNRNAREARVRHPRALRRSLVHRCSEHPAGLTSPGKREDHSISVPRRLRVCGRLAVR